MVASALVVQRGVPVHWRARQRQVRRLRKTKKTHKDYRGFKEARENEHMSLTHWVSWQNE